MVDEGVLWGFAALCKSSTDSTSLTDDINTTRMISRAFCNLTCKFTSEFMSSTACVKTLLWLTAVDDLETQDFAARGLLNVLSATTLKSAHIANQSVKYLKKLCSSSNVQVRGLCILGYCIISQFPSARREMMRQNALSALDFEVANLDPEMSYAYASTMTNMSMEPDTMKAVIYEGVLPHLLELALSTEERTVLVVARALYYCTCDSELIPTVVELGMVEGIQELLLSESLIDNANMHTYLSSSLFNISTESNCHLDIVNKDAVKTIRVLWEHGDDEIKRV